MMDCDVCFLFRGDIRYDTRLENFVTTYTSRGKRAIVIQGGDEDRTFDHAGARVTSFRSAGRGPSAFLNYWLRASQRAARVNARVYWAAELYSLPIAVWRAPFARGLIGYDSRELFAHLGALKKSPFKRKFWYGLEKGLITRCDAVVTSGEMDSEYLEERYGIELPGVARNVPRFARPPRTHRLHDELNIPAQMPVCLYIGGLQEGRGIPLMLELAAQLPEAAFVFIGDGMLAGEIDRARARLPNVFRKNKVPRDEVLAYAAAATIGLALIEPITLSYLLALPNKLFEYIMAGTPVVATHAPQMERIVEEYRVGAAVPFDCVGDAAVAIKQLLHSPEYYARCAANCRAAAEELCWEREEERFAAFVHGKGLL